MGERGRTSFLVTGLSIKLKCVNILKPFNGSKSANSEMLLAVSINVVRLGMVFAMVGWMLEIRLRARRSIRRRVERGKFPRV